MDHPSYPYNQKMDSNPHPEPQQRSSQSNLSGMIFQRGGGWGAMVEKSLLDPTSQHSVADCGPSCQIR